MEAHENMNMKECMKTGDLRAGPALSGTRLMDRWAILKARPLFEGSFHVCRI